MIGGGRRGKDVVVNDKTIRNDIYGHFNPYEDQWKHFSAFSRLLDKVVRMIYIRYTIKYS